MTVSGPMFESSKSRYWESMHRKDGGHYNNFGCDDKDGMDALRAFFPKAEACDEAFVLFSTSGVHGSYRLIEDAFEKGEPQLITFLIVQPRVCTVRHGNCNPKNQEDIAFLKSLRDSSRMVMMKIGYKSE